MSSLSAAHFPQFFRDLYDKDPFPWQRRLAEKGCAGDWPSVIDLPTASGKTACLDIALFALAVNPKSARRIFFVVDRRIIVNEAFERMHEVAKKLAKPQTDLLSAVSAKLKDLADSQSPLDVYQLRGGIYRDSSWVRNPLQPTVITSTVDQIGSRLLFRGYGVSPSSAPVHAALIANDALIFLDEAHCSRPFSQTLSSVRAYLDPAWAKHPLRKSFVFVEMTATPSQQSEKPFRLEPPDREDAVLVKRLYTGKPTVLRLVKGRAKDTNSLTEALAKQALEMANDGDAKRIAVMVNRIATAKRVFEILGKKVPAENLHLLMGRMRPIDRDELIQKLEPLKAGQPRTSGIPPTFVVSTQCLEVGADLDFDVLVSECASIDALLQRFGRLDRLGELQGNARGCILSLSGIVESKEPDAIYGAALAETWTWLNRLAGTSSQVNMGIESLDPATPTIAQNVKSLKEEARKLRRAELNAPALQAAHLDALVQTSEKPVPDPAVALFLHGRQEGPSQIQVVWRADLDDVPLNLWKQIVALCPPVSAEAMPVRLHHFRRWLSGGNSPAPDDSDLEGVGIEAEENRDADADPQLQEALIWRGDESQEVKNGKDVRPNDLVVLSLKQQGWEQLGHIPGPAEDVAEQATRQVRGRVVFRLHKQLWPGPLPVKLVQLLQNEEFDWDLWKELVEDHAEFFASKDITTGERKDFRKPLSYPAKPNEKAVETPQGWVLQLRKKIPVSHATVEEDAGDDGLSRKDTSVILDDHTRDVTELAKKFAECLVPDFVDTLTEAARLHDSGKADQRFQAMLHGGDRLAAAYAPRLLAKGGVVASGLYKTAKDKSGLPSGFRHELLSLHFASQQCANRKDLDWLLHLVASHHGYCRSFAPVVLDPDCPEACWQNLTVSAEERLAHPAHHLSSGVGRRFWRFTREFGWWGSAYLEACLRLADWQASETGQKGS